MLHRPASTFADAAPMLSADLPPLTPAAYIRLRREAANLSFERVVQALAPKEGFAAARAFLRLLETPGAKVKDEKALRLLQRVFPFDVEVYGQLANEPADRHPSVCRVRGCSFWDAENLCAPGEGCRA